VDGKTGLAEELRRRRTALGWTLEQVAAQAQVSVGMLSLIETGKRRPSLRSWERIRGALGISEPLSEETWRQQPREISDELVATLGACLAALRQATVAELASAAGASISDVRLALRRLAEQLESAGMQVLDDGSHVQLAPERTFHAAVAQLVEPERLSRLTQEQAEVLAIVIVDGMATRRRIEEVRGAAQLSIGAEGPVSLPGTARRRWPCCSPAVCSMRSATIMAPDGHWSTSPLPVCFSCLGRRRSRRHGEG